MNAGQTTTHYKEARVSTFRTGDLVANFPLGLGRRDLRVDGVVTGILPDGSPEIAAMHQGEYVRFAADAAKTERRSA